MDKKVPAAAAREYKKGEIKAPTAIVERATGRKVTFLRAHRLLGIREI
jgi:hypothetical protein